LPARSVSPFLAFVADRKSLLHSLADAYGAGSDFRVSKKAFEESDISLEVWSEFLAGLSQRMKVNWHVQHQPLYVAKEHVYVYLSASGGSRNATRCLMADVH